MNCSFAAQDDADDALEVVRSLGLRSAMEIPLVKRDRVVGALQFARTVDSPPYTQDDLLLAQLLANRVAATLENRRLDEEQRSIPRTLQASLLPARVPSIDGLDVAVRYWAAGEANIVGGDFYDVFALGDRWAFVIGDACGKGPQAASLTALARHTIRAAAWNGAEPGRVLRHLNHAIEQSDADTFCTVLYTTVTKSATGFDFAVTAGGHPLPIVHRSAWTDGTHRCTRSHCRRIRRRGMDHYQHRLVPWRHRRAVHRRRHRRRTISRAFHRRYGSPRPASLAGTRGADEVATRLGEHIGSTLRFEDRDDDIALVVITVR